MGFPRNFHKILLSDVIDFHFFEKYFKLFVKVLMETAITSPESIFLVCDPVSDIPDCAERSFSAHPTLTVDTCNSADGGGF